MTDIQYKPIGTIRTPFKEPRGTPIQTSSSGGTEGNIEVDPEYSSGLTDLDGFSHIFVIYHFHLSKKPSLSVKPYLDEYVRGLFATRAPSRPNPIGISVLRLLKLTGNILHVRDVDIIDGTPLLDIKPYVPAFDAKDVTKIGWLTDKIKDSPATTDDGRFSE